MSALQICRELICCEEKAGPSIIPSWQLDLPVVLKSVYLGHSEDVWIFSPLVPNVSQLTGCVLFTSSLLVVQTSMLYRYQHGKRLAIS